METMQRQFDKYVKQVHTQEPDEHPQNRVRTGLRRAGRGDRVGGTDGVLCRNDLARCGLERESLHSAMLVKVLRGWR